MNLLLALIIVFSILLTVILTIGYAHLNLKLYFDQPIILFFFRLAIIAASIGAGVYFSSFRWSYSETQDIIGFPIPVAAFEYSNGSWKDFISPFSFFLWGLDFIIWLGLVHLPVTFALIVKRIRQANQ